MKPIETFAVKPALPASLERLREVAYNLRWTWDPTAAALFSRLDPDLWEASNHNPVLLLRTIDQARLEAASLDEGFLAHLERVVNDLDAYVSGQSHWVGRVRGQAGAPLVAYFSLEFGVTDCLAIFAGGLGILAGDTLKSASDLGQPMVGVGLLYQQGYFRQRINAAGWQEEVWEDTDFHTLPLTLERREDGTPIVVTVPMPGRVVTAQIWRAQVGRVPLYLLDTNVEANSPEDRVITGQLYGGDIDMRIRQEIILGIGGYRALEALGVQPAVFHMNEGHSAFLAVERTRRLMQEYQCSFAEAREAASTSLVFTTHTPVAAGHDYFPPDLMDRYFGDYIRDLGISRREFLALGRQNPDNESEAFCMTILALKMSAYSKGVSRLHGEVTRSMWAGIWPGVPENEIPIGHVTNGVHLASWVMPEMSELFERYLGPRWREEPADETIWRRIEHAPPGELWRAHVRRREQMIDYVRNRYRAQLERNGAPSAEIEFADEVLDPEALTIGFARRFVAYKRATLLLRNPERLARLLNNAERPVQFVFAGKAHPHDQLGQEIIRQVYQLTRQPEFRKHVVFLEDYDITLAQLLVSGSDVWLNTPRRPREASGTSGMKAAANGVLNLSTLDGWWDEAWHEANEESEPIGWAIGRPAIYQDHDYQDQVESEALFDLLEREVVPTFYDRAGDGLPRKWIAKIKASISSLCWYFNTHRMVWEYAQRYYLPAANHFRRATENGMAQARDLAAWKARVREQWPGVRIDSVVSDTKAELQVGNEVTVRARVALGGLTPNDVAVELYLGRVDGTGNIVEAKVARMQPVYPPGGDGRTPEGTEEFAVTTQVYQRGGLQGYTVRVRPFHPEMTTPFIPGLITWADAQLAPVR